MDPSVLLRNFRENRDFLFDMIQVFFSLLYTQKLDNLSFHSVYILVNLYSSISFEVQLWSHLPWTLSSVAGTFLYGTAHIEQLHVNNYIRIYDYTCNTKTFQTIKEMVSRNLHIIINHFMHRSLHVDFPLLDKQCDFFVIHVFTSGKVTDNSWD